MLFIGVFLCNVTVYPCSDAGGTLRIPLGKNRLEALQKETEKDADQLEKACDKMRELHFERFVDVRDNTVIPSLEGAAFVVKEMDVPISSLAPTQPALEEELLGILRAQRKVYGKNWLKGKPIVVVKIKGKTFIMDGHHRAYVAHENKDDSIRAYVIRVQSGGGTFHDQQMSALESACGVRTSPNFIKTWEPKVNILSDTLHVWQAVFYNLMYPSSELRQKIIEAISYLSVDEDIFLKEARKVISEKDPLWDEYVLVEAISKLKSSNNFYREGAIEEVIEISPPVFRKAKENISYASKSENSITLNSGIVLRIASRKEKAGELLRERLDKERIATFIALKTTDHSGTVFDVKPMYNYSAGMLILLHSEYKIKEVEEFAEEMYAEAKNYSKLTQSAKKYSYEEISSIPQNTVREWQERLMGFAVKFRELSDRFDRELYQLLLDKVDEGEKKDVETIKNVITKAAEAQENRASGAILNVTKEDFDLNDAVKEVVLEKAINPMLKAKSLEVEFRLQKGLPSIILNRLSIQGAIANIVHNAKTLKEKLGITKIIVSTHLSDAKDEMIIEVLDDGLGFPENLLVQKEGKLYQEACELGNTETEGGTGLGLGETRWYVMEEHGGRIWIENPPEGGSKITITLPIIRQPSTESTLSEISPFINI